MRFARLTVEDALAAIDARDRSVGRPDEFVREPHVIRICGTRFTDRVSIALDALENFRRRRDILLGQAVDPLDDEVALLRRDHARDLAAASETDTHFGGLRRIASEAEAEAPVLHAHGFSVDRDLGTGANVTDDQAALWRVARNRNVRALRANDCRRRSGEGRPGQNELAPPPYAHRGVRPF